MFFFVFFFFQAEDGIRDLVRSRGLGDVYKRQIGECDTTIILNSDNWRYSNWDFIKEFTEGSEYEAIEKWDNTVYIADGKIYFEFYLKEIGLIYQIGFNRINAEWYITLYKIDVC